jgi:hypothetical protein
LVATTTDLVVKKTKGEYLNKNKNDEVECYRWIRKVVEED